MCLLCLSCVLCVCVCACACVSCVISVCLLCVCVLCACASSVYGEEAMLLEGIDWRNPNKQEYTILCVDGYIYIYTHICIYVSCIHSICTYVYIRVCIYIYAIYTHMYMFRSSDAGGLLPGLIFTYA